LSAKGHSAAAHTPSLSTPRLVERQRPVLFEDILADYMLRSERNKRSHDSDRRRAARFTALFRGRLARDITSREVETFKAEFLKEPRSPAPGKKRRRSATAGSSAPELPTRAVAP
jgi:hypothetical protein